MPTLDEWVQALEATYTLEVISSDALIAEVNQKQQVRIQEFNSKGRMPPPMKQNLIPVQIFAPRRSVTLTPIELLHALGRVTTPTIPNLVDISSTWAMIRYIWAFEPSLRGRIEPLQLSIIAREIDSHQKTLLSDQMGVGIASYLMGKCMNSPESIDVDVALRTPNWNIDKQFSTSPDYLFFNDSANPVYIVECKGNQTSRNGCINQLRRGTEQVPSIIFRDGRKATSLIIGSCMFQDYTETYMIDPPDERDAGYKEYPEPGGKTKKIGPTMWEVENSERFAWEAKRFSRAKKLSFAGADSEALRQLPVDVLQMRRRFLEATPQLSVIETEFGNFQGLREVLPTRSGVRLEIFQGIRSDLREIYNATAGMQWTEQNVHQDEEPHNYIDIDEGYIVRSEHTDNQYNFQSVCRDGTFLQISVS